MMAMLRIECLKFIAAAALLAFCGTPASAARVRFHYAPLDVNGNTTLRPADYGVGERVSYFGTVRAPINNQPRPTHLVTFRHPYSGRDIALPISFPYGTPRIEHVRDRLIYNYGSDTIEIRFLPDGSADVIYDSGLFRRY
jgi:hypothetical protein